MKPKEAQPLLNRILAQVGRCLTAETAQKLAALRVDNRTQALVDQLADKSTEGKLTPDEREEYLAIVSVIDFVSILQCQARQVLKRKRRVTVT